MKFSVKKSRAAIATAAALLLGLLCALCCIGYVRLSGLLPTQRAYERWRGESELRFGQLSCFMATDEKVSLEQIYTFRGEIEKKLQQAAVSDSDIKPFNDAWCAFGKVKVSSKRGSGEVYATAVGGSFFDFHPLTLISGSYFSDGDLMHDRVLLDEETAWLLYGGSELSGMALEINGEPFVVAGVVRREQDRLSLSAYTGGMGIYMSYEAFMRLGVGEAQPEQYISQAGISCYELIMAEPVDGYTYSVVSEKFPVGSGLVVNNAARYTLGNMFRLIRGIGTRSMQQQGVLLPYWENAARGTEDRCAVLLICALLCAVYPLYTLMRLLLTLGRRGRDRLTQGLMPEAKARMEEKLRVQSRRRWEKKHPGWK